MTFRFDRRPPRPGRLRYDRPSANEAHHASRTRRPRSAGDDDVVEDVRADVSAILDPAAELPGLILNVPDHQWKIDAITSSEHPGACVSYQAWDHSGVLFKGTDADHVKPELAWRYHYVPPGPCNHLDKLTAFEVVPRFFRLHRLELLLRERLRGRLEDEHLQEMRRRLALLFGPVPESP